jgi:Spy/CpxP family protein refolding chaperone
VNYWKVILATIVIFGAGVFTGGLLVQNADRSHPRFSRRPQTAPDAHPPPGKNDQTRPQDLSHPRQPEMFSRQFVQQLDDALQLTTDQRDKITKIITDGQERNRQIWTNFIPQMHKVTQEVQQQIHTALTPDQWKQFENLMKPHTSRRPASGTNAPADSATSTNLPPLTNAPGV